MNENLRRDTDDPALIEAPDLRVAVGLIHSDLQYIKNIQVEQSETLKQVHELLQIFNDAKGFAKTVGWFAKIAMWLSLFGGGVAAIWLTLTNKK